MTLCKTLKLFQQTESGGYRKKDVVADLRQSEFQATHYFDPDVNIICSFFNENDTEYENVHTGNDFRFKRRDGGAPGFVIPAWEQAARRCVFFHHADQKDGCYDFLGLFRGVSVLQNLWVVYSPL